MTATLLYVWIILKCLALKNKYLFSVLSWMQSWRARSTSCPFWTSFEEKKRKRCEVMQLSWQEWITNPASVRCVLNLRTWHHARAKPEPKRAVHEPVSSGFITRTQCRQSAVTCYITSQRSCAAHWLGRTEGVFTVWAAFNWLELSSRMQFVVLAQVGSRCQTHAIVCYTLLCEPYAKPAGSQNAAALQFYWCHVGFRLDRNDIASTLI